MATLSKKVDALVVGAGPVGLLAAWNMARSGLTVEIIDRAWRSSAQSYACGLHAATVEQLIDLGLGDPLLEAGLRIDTVAFYEGATRKAEIRPARTVGRNPQWLVLPQDRLEEILEDALRELGVRVRWGHRLDDLHNTDGCVLATVEKLALTSVGYPYARSEEMVASATDVEAAYVVGADGAESHVRQILGIGWEPKGAPCTYEVLEMDGLAPCAQEIRIGTGAGTADVYWPQQGAVARWSLEVTAKEPPIPERPTKERRTVVLLDDDTDASTRQQLADRLKERAPWFDSGIREIEWRTLVTFKPGRAKSFGIGRVWLAGDAGHQAHPIGMQSMNVGLREALDLAGRITGLLRNGAEPGTLHAYNNGRIGEWDLLLGGGESIVPQASASAWAKAQRKRLLSWIPGSGDELPGYLVQLGFALDAKAIGHVPSLA